jgi:LDH2 family malate/lactate/ureidoglycolate dehydrogenase
MAAQIERLDQDYGVHIPGMSKAKTRDSAATEGVDIDDKFLARLQAMVG